MERKFVRVALKSLKVHFNGDEPPANPPREPETKDSKKLDNLLTAVLVYPRPGVESVTTVKTIDLPSGFPYMFEPEDFWQSGLFKEEILSEARLVVTVIDKDKMKLLEKLFRGFLTGVFSGWVNPVIKGIGNLALGTAAGQIGETLSGAFKGKDKQKVVATSGPVDLWVNGGQLFFKQRKFMDGWQEIPADGQIELKLFTPEKLVLPQQQQDGPRGSFRDAKGNLKKGVRPITMSAGDDNGLVALKFKVN